MRMVFCVLDLMIDMVLSENIFVCGASSFMK